MHTFLVVAPLLLAAPTVQAEPVYLAVCREVPEQVFPRGVGMRVELVGEIRGTSLLQVDVGTVKEPDALAFRIPGLAWQYLTPGGETGRAERFGEARLTFRWNEPHEDGEHSGVGGEESLLVLGPCDDAGTLYATTEISGAASAQPSARDDRRVRDELDRIGIARDVEVDRIGEAVVARGRVAPLREAIDARRSAMPDASGTREWSERQVSVMTVVHPDLTAPLTLGALDARKSVEVLHARLVRLGGEDLAVVVSELTADEGGRGTSARVIFLRTGEWADTILVGFGC